MSEELDLPGRWEIRTTIYRNGRRVGTVDTAEWDTFDDAAYWVGQGLSTRDVDMHQPRPRREGRSIADRKQAAR